MTKGTDDLTAVQRWTGHESRALRYALRLSVRAFAEELGVAVRTVSKWEARGATTVPRPDNQAILDTALGRADATAHQRFALLCDSGSNLPPAVDPAEHTADAFTPLDTPAAESMELLRRMDESDLGPGLLDQLDDVVERLAVEYFTVPPAQSHQRCLTWRRYVARLLDGRATLRERSRLYAVAGWLTGLLAEASLAIGVDARVHCATALSLAEEVGHPGLAGWVRGTQAQVALYAGDPRDAVAFAQAGREVAPAGSAALVRTHTYLARASARCDDRTGTEAALSAAELAWERMTQTIRPSIFSLSSSYLPYCASTAFVWLGDPKSARSWAAQAAANQMGGASQPTVGRAIARLDLAIAAAQLREPEEASAIGSEAINICAGRLTIPARKRIDELLGQLAPYHESCVVELREEWRWISR